ncbi:MAG: hypothetical protein LBD24_03120 [Spirochaetaceae bacterium]|nr:hypothetical protein [Spirochaetaceae bacterium]
MKSSDFLPITLHSLRSLRLFHRPACFISFQLYAANRAASALGRIRTLMAGGLGEPVSPAAGGS